jgi:metal-responsive CopG/Arc/MetJ family transcriptional regulator
MEKTDKIKNKDRRIGIRVDEKSFITLNKIADKKKISFSELVRLAIESYIKK